MNSIVDKDVEAHLNNLFRRAAREKKVRMVNKCYKYIIYNSELDHRVKEEGRCIIKDIEYNEREDCDYITFTKMPEDVDCTLNQFAVDFLFIEEIEPNSRC